MLSVITDKKHKPVAEGSVSRISTWIIAALRNEQFFSVDSLNREIRKKLEEYNNRPFAAKEGSRSELFRDEELPLLAPLPHITVEFMHYSCPYEFIGKEVDVRLTDSAVEIFYNQSRIASHKRLHGRRGQYSTIANHMPEKHQHYQEWNGERFRKWARKIGTNTYKVVDSILSSKAVEEQSYLTCRSLLKLSDTYSTDKLEEACSKACQFTREPSYKSVKNILVAMNARNTGAGNGSHSGNESDQRNLYGITRGAHYYGGEDHAE